MYEQMVYIVLLFLEDADGETTNVMPCAYSTEEAARIATEQAEERFSETISDWTIVKYPMDFPVIPPASHIVH